MRKIITIGESTYQIHFSGNNPRHGFPGGVILNATASLAMAGIDTFMVSETACDYFGNQIADYLKNAGVDMNTRKPVNDALALFGKLLDEMEEIMTGL